MITTNVSLTEAEVHAHILERTKDSAKQSFVLPEELKDITAYKKFEDSQNRKQFREALLQALENTWEARYGVVQTSHYKKRFQEIVDHLDDNGAMVFGSIFNNSDFGRFLDKYITIMNSAGSKSWLHSFVNLAPFHEFINSQEFNGPFLHPLLIALIAYQMGGMVRLADCRAKDVEPSAFLGSDSRLHIDGTPFEERYHILLSWEKGKTSGPKGQNFAFIPGTHKGVRNSFVNSKEEVWATENGNIFITEERVDQIFDIQKRALQLDSPLVIEACYPLKPLTILFDAASLAHHRYRNVYGSARSSIAIAFRRINLQEQFSFLLPTINPDTTRLNHFLFENCADKTENNFIDSLAVHASDIADLIDRLDAAEDCAEIIAHHDLHTLSPVDLQRWKEIITEAPDIEKTKANEGYLPLNQAISQEAFFTHLVKMIMLDKHGTLDLIFYSDNHEQIRQATRIQIREMKQEQITAILEKWKETIKQPEVSDLLPPKQLQQMASLLAEQARAARTQQCHSIAQFLEDLGEAIVRSDHRQTFLSTALFLFLACDALCMLCDNPLLAQTGQKLLANYIATAILNEQEVHRM